MKTKQVEMEAMREAELKLKKKVCYVNILSIIDFFQLNTELYVLIFFKDQKKIFYLCLICMVTYLA